LAVERNADALHKSACEALQRGHYRLAMTLAASAVRYWRRRESAALLAAAAAMAGDFTTALRTARQARAMDNAGTRPQKIHPTGQDLQRSQQAPAAPGTWRPRILRDPDVPT